MNNCVIKCEWNGDEYIMDNINEFPLEFFSSSLETKRVMEFMTYNPQNFFIGDFIRFDVVSTYDNCMIRRGVKGYIACVSLCDNQHGFGWKYQIIDVGGVYNYPWEKIINIFHIRTLLIEKHKK